MKRTLASEIAVFVLLAFIRSRFHSGMSLKGRKGRGGPLLYCPVQPAGDSPLALSPTPTVHFFVSMIYCHD